MVLKNEGVTWLSAQRAAPGSRRLQSAIVAYRRHFEAIRKSLPPGVLLLTEGETLHDASVISLEVDAAASSLSLELRGWDHRFRKARFLALSYEDVRNISISAPADRPLPGPPGFGALGYWEFDVDSPGFFKHCMLFSTGIELAVRFAQFAYTVSSRSTRVRIRPPRARKRSCARGA